MTREPILIAGGGIGGAAAALALARQGWPVRVLEQLREFGEIGAGIQLGPNVYKMLETLGLTGAIDAPRCDRMPWSCGTLSTVKS